MRKKFCSSCGETKSLEEFNVRQGRCRLCWNKAARDRRANMGEFDRVAYRERERQRARRYREAMTPAQRQRRREWHQALQLRRYGLTKADYDTLVDRQGGVCAACLSKRVLVVDHCHGSGSVRGLLCNPCNLVLGHVADDVVVLRRLADYVEEAQTRNGESVEVGR